MITLVIVALGAVMMLQRYRENNDITEWDLQVNSRWVIGGVAAIVLIVGGIVAWQSGVFAGNRRGPQVHP